MRAFVRTDVGAVRERNEDSAYADPDGRFVVLADGMGGHRAGDVASTMAVEIVRHELEAAAADLAALAAAATPDRRRRVRAHVEAAIARANDAIFTRSRREPDKHGMGTTLEILVFAGDEALLAHVGDSRTYLVRDGLVAQLTEDHTVAESLRRCGTLSDAEAAASPLRTALSSAVGVMNDPHVDHLALPIRPGDRLLV